MAAKKSDETTVTEQKKFADLQGQDPKTSDPQAPPADPSGEQPESIPTVRALLLTNVKHNQLYYKAGQKEDLPGDVFKELEKAKAARRLGE